MRQQPAAGKATALAHEPFPVEEWPQKTPTTRIRPGASSLVPLTVSVRLRSRSGIQPILVPNRPSSGWFLRTRRMPAVGTVTHSRLVPYRPDVDLVTGHASWGRAGGVPGRPTLTSAALRSGPHRYQPPGAVLVCQKRCLG